MLNTKSQVGTGIGIGVGVKRFWEVDALRGAAVVMMILFHLVFDLNYFHVKSFDVYSGFLLRFSELTASMFVLLAGISLSLSRSRSELLGIENAVPSRLFKRGLKIFSIGLGITLVTYLAVGDGFIIFGILHMLGLSIILAYPFLSLGRANALIGLVFISAGLYLQNLTFPFPWLLWLGFSPEAFYTLDYFPLLPWFGVVLIGIFLGNLLYPGYRRRIDLPDADSLFPVKVMDMLGRNSLSIYLIHQPILITTLFLSGMISFPVR